MKLDRLRQAIVVLCQQHAVMQPYFIWLATSISWVVEDRVKNAPRRTIAIPFEIRNGRNWQRAMSLCVNQQSVRSMAAIFAS